MAAPSQSCGGCFYARPIANVPSLVAVACCRNVPELLVPAEAIEEPDARLRWGFWPAVKPDAWCGEYKALPPQVQQLPKRRHRGEA